MINERSTDESGLGRREVLQAAAMIAGGIVLGIGQHAAAQGADAKPVAGNSGPAESIKAPTENLVGIQMGPHTLCDEGIDRVMDLCQETAGINAFFIYCHAYGGDLKKNLNVLATDHGVPPKDQRTRNLPLVWVRQHDDRYRAHETTLRHPTIDNSYDYHERDLFAELVAPARKRGIKIYPRILEAGPRGIVNFDKVATQTITARRTQVGCWNHPEYRGFWNATVEDLFASYDVDGFQWGAERQGPLINMLLNGTDTAATCFCEHCIARGRKAGIDPERARKGFAEVVTFVQGMRNAATGKKPDVAVEGALAGFLRVLLHYPEVLTWEYQYRLGREEVMKGMYDTIKKIKPGAPVGWHVDHWAVCMDPFYRAEMSYAEMSPWSDYLKIVVYHAVTGPRMRSYLDRLQRGVLGDLTLETAFSVWYDYLGYDKKVEPGPAEANRRGFGADYVYRETLHSMNSLGDAKHKTRIYPGIGFNVPGSPPDDPEVIYQCVKRAYEAGAGGIVASREYEEMTVPNLKAVGRAVRELVKA